MTGTVVEHGAFYGSPAGFQFTSLAMFDGSVERCGTGTFVVWFPLLRGGPTPFRGDLEVVEGSGTGELTGLRGTGAFTYRHGETKVPYTFAYEVAHG